MPLQGRDSETAIGQKIISKHLARMRRTDFSLSCVRNAHIGPLCILQPDPLAGSQAFSGGIDTFQKPGIVFQSIIEPFVFRFETNQLHHLQLGREPQHCDKMARSARNNEQVPDEVAVTDPLGRIEHNTHRICDTTCQ